MVQKFHMNFLIKTKNIVHNFKKTKRCTNFIDNLNNKSKKIKLEVENGHKLQTSKDKYFINTK
jgi:hypothetical protein